MPQTVEKRFMRLFILSLLLFCFHLVEGLGDNYRHLHVGFYTRTCPWAEEIVSRTVLSHALFNPGVTPGLIRLHFHDCFVRGCDASVLLDSTPTGEPVEKVSPGNVGLRGLQVIDDAKALLEKACPNTVSCADILAFAARDAASLVGIPHYTVLAGRRDGNTSLASDAMSGSLPSPYSTAETLTKVFAQKGLSQEEMVVLSGAHSIGDAHCSSIYNRLYKYKPEESQDPSIDPVYAEYLKMACPMLRTPGAENRLNSTVKLNSLLSPRLDNSYYVGLRMGKGLLASDQALMNDDNTRKLVRKMALHPHRSASKFAKAMRRMGSIEVMTGQEGEVRRSCRLVN